MFENPEMLAHPEQTKGGWVAYGNAYQDLKDEYCGGGTCGTDQWWALRTHCYDYGVDEARPIPRTSGSSCKGNFVVPKAEDVNSAARIQSPWEGRNECFDEGPGSTLYMHTCHDGDNRARRTVLFAHPYTLPHAHPQTRPHWPASGGPSSGPISADASPPCDGARREVLFLVLSCERKREELRAFLPRGK